MTNEQLTIIVCAIPPTIAAVSALVVALKANRKQDENTDRIQEVHLMINSRMDQLLKVTENASFAKGAKSETDKEKV